MPLMSLSMRRTARTASVAIRTMALLTVLLGLGYTLTITAVGQLALPARADGSILLGVDGKPVGSSLLGQSASSPDGAPLPEYFQPRPSAAGDGYDGGSSSGSNLGPENPDLIAQISERRRQVAAFNGVDEAEVPADAVTASASGLDPHISSRYAALQVDRVAAVRGIPVDEVRRLVRDHTRGPALGYLGEETVDVLGLNLALDEREDRG